MQDPNQSQEVRSFSTDDTSMILLTPFFILEGVKKDQLEVLTAAIIADPKNYKPMDKDKIIYLKTIDKMKDEHDDSFLDLNYSLDGKSDSSYLKFENREILQEFIYDFNTYTESAFQAKTIQCTRWEAASFPLSIGIVVLVLGSILTYVVNMFQNYEPARTRVVKAYIYYFYKFCKLIGPYPVAIITIILLLFCIGGLIKRFIKPPMKTTYKRY